MKNNFSLSASFSAIKKLLPFFFIFFCFTTRATTYYFSASGSDGNTGTSSSSPWQTLNKLNSIFGSLNPGDNVLFNRGDIFYGNILVTKSGSSGAPITIGAYGSGAIPVISGFNKITSWTNLGGNIWESTNSVSNLPYTNMVAINGKNTPMGRYPNTGYKTIASSSSNSITDGKLSGSWNGANVVIKENRWTIDNCKITGQSGGTLTYARNSGYTPIPGFGYFIQNSSQTLDVQDEWYYNPSTQKLRIYSYNTPNNVQISSVETLVNVNSTNYITFSNLSFQGANTAAFKFNNAVNLTVQNCNINFSGLDAINSYSCRYLSVLNCNISNTNNCAIYAGSSSNYGDNVTITNNVIKSTGIASGMGNATSYGYYAISAEGNSSTIQSNEIDSTGFIGIRFSKNSAVIANNFLNYFCLVADDGAGIYTYHGDSDPNVYTNRQVTNNIVLNGVGCSDGTDASTQFLADGIYMDDGVMNVAIIGNSVANCSDKGIHIHNTHDVTFWNNTVYNSETQLVLNEDGISTSKVRNIDIKNNVIFSKLASQFILEYRTAYNDINSFFTSDNNYFTRPIQESPSAFSVGVGNSGSMAWSSFDLNGFKKYFNKDGNSNKAPKTITDVNDLRFEYNPTSANKTISLDASYIDVKNNSYNGSITLQPYTSAVLIRNGPLNKSAAVQITLSGKSDVGCLGGSDGSVQVSASGGTAPYTYSFNYGPFVSDNTFSDLKAGSYIIYASDVNGSQASTQVTIADGSNECNTGSFILSLSANSNTSCPGSSDGSILVNSSGGTAPYTYNINYGKFSSNNNFANLKAGSYVIYARDNDGSETSLSVSVVDGSGLCSIGSFPLKLIGKSDVSCLGGSNGNIQVGASGGTAPYTYNINYGLFSSNNVFSNLNAGLYIIYARDKKGLESSLAVTVASGLGICVPFQLNLVDKSNVSCLGASDGSIEVTPDGGTAPYIYNINYGTFTSNNNFTNLEPGSYIVYARDANGIETSYSTTIENGTSACVLGMSNNTAISSANSIGNSALEISVFPNPTKTYFSLTIKSPVNDKAIIEVMDVNGKKLYQAVGNLNSQNIFGNNFLSGMYIVRVLQGNNVKTLKIIKAK